MIYRVPKKGQFVTLLVILLASYQNEVSGSVESEIIGSWAETFGEELWDLAQKMTKAPEIKFKYKTFNARVEVKDGEALIESIAENVGKMLNRKMDAVKCIAKMAEEVSREFGDFSNNDSIAENFTYYNSKYSQIYKASDVSFVAEKMPSLIPESINKSLGMYKDMYFDQDTHFYNLWVNTTHSSVQVPTNVYDKLIRTAGFIQWSEELDVVFRQNYNEDPALSWQYFASNTGILRHFPSMSWDRKKVDTFDCRKRSWYIETATCSKDVVILLDNSGSMTGYRNYIAQLTVRSLLDTFSNNDFINIYNYSKGIDDIIPCFKDMLVQATPENIEVFNDAISKLVPEGFADVKNALSHAFTLLEKYRDLRKCGESASGCNQAIFLVTDGVSGNATDIFEKYNMFENGTRTPVRIFTYLLGKEVTKVREIQFMACLNRGYFSHIQSIDEVAEEVLKYVNVIATPLVLQNEEHPPTWTHAFTDTAHVQNSEPEDEPRLMIAVGVPAFDIKKNEFNNQTISAKLLGVAGTDVDLEDINKLTLPYKLGVNGYSFIVSNNGYVLLHPDLRPISDGQLKDNYNSFDIVEIEQIDEEREPRDPSELILEIRKKLVESEKGKKLKVPVRFHYDKMRRISQEDQDFYFAPLPHTPFSLGLVLPHDYGNTWIKVGDEIRRNQHMNVSISDFFVGQNWKVHPEWVYCKYHYLEGHEFAKPEEELTHFLKKLNEKTWKWSQQYETDTNPDDELDCGGKTLDKDDYYCNKELVQLLVFDAKVTNDSYRSWKFESELERQIIERYNATLRFVASMSGLTRWQFIFGEVEVDNDAEFGDYHTTAIDEQWYKSAILQHKTDQQSFFYSVPHKSDPAEDGELQVTASMAIFPRDGGIEAPGCVVGFQFSHELMMERFMEITSKSDIQNLTCAFDGQDCYVIDNNGYIILSEERNDTGRFFGEVEGAIMESMVEAKIFKEIVVYDFQALCFKETYESSSANDMIFNPIKFIVLGVQWLITELIWSLSRINLWIDGAASSMDEVYGDYDANNEAKTTVPLKKIRKGQNQEEEDYFNTPKILECKREYYPCDQKTNLYILDQHMFIQGRDYSEEAPTNCSKPYFVKRIPKSNLLFISVNALFGSCVRKMSAEPQVITYNNDFPCHKLNMNHWPRRRLDECFTEHNEEEAVTYCGSGSQIEYNILLIILLVFFLKRLVN